MTNPVSLPSKPKEPKRGQVCFAHPKKPVEAVCQSVKEAVTNELNCRLVKQVDCYQSVHGALAHIQEKKAKSLTYKKGDGEITLDELFLIQNGENHG